MDFIEAQTQVLESLSDYNIRNPESMTLLERVAFFSKHAEYQDEIFDAPFCYCYRGDKVAIQDYLQSSGADVNMSNADNVSLLHCAVLGGQFEIVQHLLELKADPNTWCTSANMTVLMDACKKQDASIVKLLINYHARVTDQGGLMPDGNMANAKNTALHIAAVENNVEVVKTIIECLSPVETHSQGLSNPHFSSTFFESTAHSVKRPNKSFSGASHPEVSSTAASANKYYLNYNPSQLSNSSKSPTIAVNSASLCSRERCYNHNHSSSTQRIVSSSLVSPQQPFTSVGQLVQPLLKELCEITNESGHTALMEAAQAGHFALVKLMLFRGADIHTISHEFKESPISLAAYRGHVDIVRFLTNHGAAFDQKVDEIHTPMMEAIMDGHFTTIKCLVNFGASFHPNGYAIDNVESPLSLSVGYGHSDLLAYFLSHGCDMLQRNEEGFTHLMEACREGFDEIAEYLLLTGADVNALTSEHEETALSVSASGGSDSLCNLLLRHGADVNLGMTTPLMEASQEGHLHIVKLLLNHGAEVNKSAHVENSIAQVTNVGLCGQPSSVSHTKKDAKYHDGDTALHYAVDNGLVPIVRTLVEAMADVEMRCHSLGQTALMKASTKGSLDIVRIVIEVGNCDVNALDVAGTNTALSLACRNGHLEIVKYLLIWGANRGVKLKYGNNCMFEAVRSGNKELAELIYRTPVKNILVRQSLYKNISMVGSECEPEAVSVQAQIISGFSYMQDNERIHHTSSTCSTKSLPDLDDESDESVTRTRPSSPYSISNENGMFEGNDTNQNYLGHNLSPFSLEAQRSPMMPPQQLAMPNVNKNEERIANQYVWTYCKENNIDPVELSSILQNFNELFNNKELMDEHATSLNEFFPRPSPVPVNAHLEGDYSPGIPIDGSTASCAPAPYDTNFVLTEPYVPSAHYFMAQRPPVIPGEDTECGSNKDVLLPTPNSCLSFPTVGRIAAEQNQETQTSLADDFVAPSTVLDIPGTLVVQDPIPVEGGFFDLSSRLDHGSLETPLHVACHEGHSRMVEFLLSLNCPTDVYDKFGTPLHSAVQKGQLEVIKSLLEKGVAVDAVTDKSKESPLMVACTITSRPDINKTIELLLKYGANIEMRNSSDYTPLCLAALHNNLPSMRCLINHNAEINSRSHTKLGITPLMLASMHGYLEAADLLIEKGADVNCYIETNRNTALTLAAFQGKADVVRRLVEAKATVEHRAKNGVNPLMEAAQGGHLEVAEILIKHGADVNNCSPNTRDTPLYIASDKGHPKFVNYLLQNGASVDVRNKRLHTSLYQAAQGGHTECVKILLDYGANPNIDVTSRGSVLQIAYSKGHVEVVKALIGRVKNLPAAAVLKKIKQNLCADVTEDVRKNISEAYDIIQSRREEYNRMADENSKELLRAEEEENKEKDRQRERRLLKKAKKRSKKKRNNNGQVEAENCSSPEHDPPPNSLLQQSNNHSHTCETAKRSLCADDEDDGDDDVRRESKVPVQLPPELSQLPSTRHSTTSRPLNDNSITSKLTMEQMALPVLIASTMASSKLSSDDDCVKPASRGRGAKGNRHSRKINQALRSAKNYTDSNLLPATAYTSTLPIRVKKMEDTSRKRCNTQSSDNVPFKECQLEDGISVLLPEYVDLKDQKIQWKRIEDEKNAGLRSSPILQVKQSVITSKVSSGLSSSACQVNPDPSLNCSTGSIDGLPNTFRKDKSVLSKDQGYIVYSVPSNLVGRILGQGGSCVSAIRQKSGANVEISNEKDLDSHANRTVVIKGKSKHVSVADQLVFDLLKGFKTSQEVAQGVHVRISNTSPLNGVPVEPIAVSTMVSLPKRTQAFTVCSTAKPLPIVNHANSQTLTNGNALTSLSTGHYKSAWSGNFAAVAAAGIVATPTPTTTLTLADMDQQSIQPICTVSVAPVSSSNQPGRVSRSPAVRSGLDTKLVVRAVVHPYQHAIEKESPQLPNDPVLSLPTKTLDSAITRRTPVLFAQDSSGKLFDPAPGSDRPAHHSSKAPNQLNNISKSENMELQSSTVTNDSKKMALVGPFNYSQTSTSFNPYFNLPSNAAPSNRVDRQYNAELGSAANSNSGACSAFVQADTTRQTAMQMSRYGQETDLNEFNRYGRVQGTYFSSNSDRSLLLASYQRAPMISLPHETDPLMNPPSRSSLYMPKATSQEAQASNMNFLRYPSPHPHYQYYAPDPAYSYPPIASHSGNANGGMFPTRSELLNHSYRDSPDPLMQEITSMFSYSNINEQPNSSFRIPTTSVVQPHRTYMPPPGIGDQYNVAAKPSASTPQNPSDGPYTFRDCM